MSAAFTVGNFQGYATLAEAIEEARRCAAPDTPPLTVYQAVRVVEATVEVNVREYRPDEMAAVKP